MIAREIAGLPDNYSPQNLMILLCYRYNKNNLYQLLQFLGMERFIEFMGVFAGCYLKMPPADRVSKLIDDYRMVLLASKALKAMKENNLKAWQQYDSQFRMVCSRERIEEKTGRKRVRKVRAEIRSAIKWIQSREGQAVVERVKNRLDESMEWYLDLARLEYRQKKAEI